MDILFSLLQVHFTMRQKELKRGCLKMKMQGMTCVSFPQFAEKAIDMHQPKPPLCKGWCSAQRMKMKMIASGNHTIIPGGPPNGGSEGLTQQKVAYSPILPAKSKHFPAQSLSHGVRRDSSLCTREPWVLPHRCRNGVLRQPGGMTCVSFPENHRINHFRGGTQAAPYGKN